MSLSIVVENYLNQSHVPFSLLEHPHTRTSMQTARTAHVAPTQLAKAVVVRGGNGYLMCVLPAAHLLVLNWLDRDRQEHFRLATEEELGKLFPDCETGAVPALGQAYGMPVLWDNSLRHAEEVYFEAGDHRHLIHIGRDQFMDLMHQAEHATISCTPDTLEYYRNVH